jgi:hypothetical protein
MGEFKMIKRTLFLMMIFAMITVMAVPFVSAEEQEKIEDIQDAQRYLDIIENIRKLWMMLLPMEKNFIL